GSHQWNHNRTLSHARPKMLAAGTSVRATSGNSAIDLPSSETFTVPTGWPCVTGATSGSVAAIVNCSLSALPLGSVRYRSATKPAGTSFAAPFHTRNVDTGLPA